MISTKEKERILKNLLNAEIPEEHWEEVRKRVIAENKRYEEIAKAQTPSWEDMNRPFDI